MLLSVPRQAVLRCIPEIFRLDRIILVTLGLVLLCATKAFGAVTITPATNGVNISADKAANASSPMWTSLGPIVIDETSNPNRDNFASGNNVTLVLKAPAGFQFNTAVTPNITFTSGQDITSAAIAMTDSTTITITLTISGTSNVDRLTVGSVTRIQVRPTAGTPLASGQIFRPSPGGGSATITGIIATGNANGSGGTSFGTLSEVVGAAAKVVFTTQPGSANAGSIFSVQPVVKSQDQFGNNSSSGLPASLNVTVTLTSGTGPLQGTTVLNIGTSGGSGTVSYTDLSIGSGGTNKQLTAGAPGLANGLSSVFSINGVPTISAIGDQMTDEDTPTGAIDFSISDAETPANSLSLDVDSSNPSLVPNANINSGGTGSNRTVTITPAPNQHGTSTITIVVSDGMAARSNSFVLTVKAVNDAPVISAISGRVINEDTSTNITFTVSDVETTASALILSTNSSDTSLVPNANISMGGSGTNRSITLTPLPNGYGMSTITITASDGTNITARDFLLTVNAVNDAPTLDAISNLTVFVNGGLQTVNLSGITFGPANENQSLSVAATSSNPALIPNPGVNYSSPDPTGTLTFSPANNASGTATINVIVQDTGGTANGGQNTVTQQFVVTVIPLTDLAISNVATPNPVFFGGSLTYTLIITNRGPSTAGSVTVTDVLPGNVNFVSSTASQGSCVNQLGTISCNLGTITNGRTATVTIVVTPNDLGTITNTASVTTTITDTNSANDAATALVTVNQTHFTIDSAVLTSENCNNGLIDPAEMVTVNFALKNLGTENTGNLVATLRVADGVSSPSGPQTYGVLVAGGAAVSRPFSFTASGFCGGTILAALQFQDGSVDYGIATVTLNLGNFLTNQTSFRKTNLIAMPPLGRATPYPSTNIVSGLLGTVIKLTVTLSNLNHTWPDDLDILLVGPEGQKVILMSDAGQERDLTNVTLTFDDLAGELLPNASQIVSGTFRPSDYESGDVLPSPVPAGPYGTALSVFNGTSPNGTWNLFIADDTVGDEGTLAGGWSLSITTLDPNCCVPTNAVDVRISASDSPDPLVVGHPLTYTLNVTNTGPASATGVIVTNILPAGVIFGSASSSQGSCSNNSGIVRCNLGTLPSNAAATVTISVTPPQPGILANQARVIVNQPDFVSTNNSVTVLTTVTTPVLSITTAEVAEGDTGTTNAVFTVSLSEFSSQTVTVHYATADDTANAGSDYISTNGVLTFNPGDLEKTITVVTRGDVLNEATELYSVNLFNPVNATFGVSQGAGLITDDDPLPSVSIADAFGPEGNVAAGLAVILSAASGQEVTVNFATANGTATAPADYASTNGTLVFNAGETNKTVFVALVGDNLNESNETFFVNLFNEVNANIGDGQGVATIANDDPFPTIRIVATAVTAEDCSPANMGIDPDETVTVSFSLRNVSAGPANANNLVATLRAVGGVVSPSGAQNYGALTVGGPAVSRSFTFSGSGNCGESLYAVLQLQDGPNDLGFVTNTFRVGGFSFRTNVFANSSLLTVLEGGPADPYPSTITVSGITGAVTKVTVTLTNIDHTYPADMDVLLVGPMGQMVMLMSDAGIAGGISGVTLKFDDAASNFLPEFDQIVSGTYKPSNYDAEDSFDPPAPPGPYDNPLLSVFNGEDPNGAWSLYVFDDVGGDGGSFTAGWRITMASQGDPICCGINSLADLAISKVDAPDPIIFGSNLTYTITITNRGPYAASGVIINDPLPGNLSFVSATSTLGSCTNSSGVVTCELGSITNTARVTITVTATTIAAGRITNSASIYSVTSDPIPTNNTAAAVTTILPIVSIAATDANASETAPNGGLFTVSRIGGTAGSLAVNYAMSGTAANGSDFVALSGTVTISNGSASGTIALTPVDDFLVEPIESVILTISTNTAYAINASSNAASVMILDNDVQGIVLSTNRITVPEGSSSTFSVRLSAQPTNMVTVVNAFNSGDADLSVSAGAALTFTSNNWNVAQQVTVGAAADDDIVNGQATFTVSSAGLTSQTVTAVEVDDDTVRLVLSTNVVTVPEGASNLFTVRLTAQPTNLVTVTTVHTSGDADLSVGDGATLVFAATNWNIAQTVLLNAAVDADGINDQATFTVSSAGLSNLVLTAIEADKDLVQLIVSTNRLLVPEESSSSFTVRLTAEPSSNLTVNITAVTGGDTNLTVTAGASLVFTPADWNAAQTVTISASADDNLVNGQADFVLSGPGMTNHTVKAIEVNNDVLGLLLSTVENLRITDIRLADTDAIISFLTVPGSLYRVERTEDLGTLLWTTVADDIPGTGHTVEVNDTGGGQQPMRFYRLRLLSSANPGLITVLEGGTNVFTVRLNVQPTNSIAVTTTRVSGDTNLSVVNGGTLTFNPANWNVSQTVAVRDAEDDDAANGLAGFTIFLAGVSNQIVSAIEADNDEQFLVLSTNLLLVPEGTNRTFTVRLNAQPLTNVTVVTAFSSGNTNLRVSAGAALVFNPTNWNIARAVAIGAIEDGDTDDATANFNVSYPGLSTVSVSAHQADNDLQDLAQCPGGDALFSTAPVGSGPFTFVWRQAGNVLVGETNSSLLLTNVTATDAGPYSVEVNYGPATVIKSGTLNVNTPITISGPSNRTNCPGGSVTFSTVVSGTGPLSYQWSKDGTNLDGATNSSLVLTNLNAADAGAYCVVANGPCNSVTNCASLTINVPVTANGPSNQTNCPGSSVTLSTVADGTGPLSYQWTKNGTNVTGATNSSLVLTNLNATNAGNYCVVVNGACNRVTNCATLTINLPVTASGPSNQTNCVGSSVTLSTVANGTGPLSYQWSKDGTSLSGATNASLVMTNLDATNAGNYCVVVSGACNSVTNCGALTINVPVTANGPSNQTNCPGSSVTLSTVADGTGPLSYQWRKNGTNVTGATNSSLVLTNLNATNAGNYCVVVSGGCNSVTNCATLTIDLPVTASGPSNQTNCVGSSVTLSTVASGTGPLSYQWSKDGTSLSGATDSSLVLTNLDATNAGNYCVVVNGACNSVTKLLFVAPLRIVPSLLH